MPTPNENLLNLHKNISARDPKFTMPYDAFEAKMQDEGNRKSLYKNLSQRDPDFKMEYEDFTAKIGYGVDNGVYNTGENGVDNTGEKPNTESGFWAAQRNAWISKGRSIQYGLADQIHNLSDEKIKEDIFKFAKAGIIPLQSENPADYDNVIQKTQEQISDLQKAREPIMSEVENKKRKEIQAYKDTPGTFRSLFLGKPGILKEDLYSDPEITAIDKQIKELNDITKAALTARGILVTQGQFAVKKAASDAHYGDENEWGERTMKKAADVMRNLPEPVGFMGKAGSMVPDIAGSAVGAITAIFNAPAGAAIIHLNMATMGAQSYGSTLFQIDEYAKETGKEIDEDTRQMVAVGGALVEGITEYVRIPGITAPMKKMSGQMAKRLFLKEAIKNPTLAVDMVKGFVGKNTTLAKRLAAGLWDIAKLSNRQGLEEAAEEAVSSIGQDFLSYAYLNPEDTPGFSEMLSNATNAAKMAYMTGPVFGSINKYGKYRNVRQARQSNGFVTLIADNKGNTFEGLYEKDNGDYVAADINGSEKTIKADEVGEISRFGTRDFERLTAMAKKGQEASAELYANAELDLEHKAIESQIKAKLYQGQEQHQLMVNGVEQENAQVIITVETIDGNQYQVIDGFVNKPEPSAPIIGINLKTGEKTIISPINISKTDVVPADQMRAELRAEAQNRIKDKYQLQSIAAQIQDEFQPGDIVTFNGQEAEIVDVTDPTQGVSIKITDAKGGEQVFTIAPDQLGALQNPDQGSQNPDQPTHTQTFTVGKKKFNYTESEDGVIFIEFEGGKDESKAIIAEVDDTKYDVKTISEEVPIPDAPPFAKVKTRTVAKGLQITPKAAKKPIELPSSKPKAASTEIKFNSPVNTPNGQGILKERIQGTDIYNVEMQSGGIKTFRMEQLNQVTTNEQGTAVTQEANQPIYPATEQVTNQPTQGAETAVQPSAEPVGSGTAEVATPILEGKATNQQETPEITPENAQDTPASQAPASPDVNNLVAGENGEIAQAEAQVNTEPTEGQKEAGNYQKGHVTVQGLDITIENPKGSTRSGVDKDGNAWSVEMKNTYGYFKRTNGKDGDQIDVFIGDNPLSEKVFVVDQLNDKGEFDESKVMIGFDTAIKAKAAYMSNYSPGWKGFGSITETSVEDFKEWLYDGARQRKAFAEYKDTPNPRPTTAGEKLEQILDADLKAKAEQAKAKAEKQALADKKSERARRAAENKAKRESLNLEQGDDAYTAYLKAIESGDVTEEALSNMTDHDYIMRFSSNPLEILNAINKIDHYIPEDQLDKVEAAIAAYMTKVPPASAARFGDRNAFAMNMARSYFAKKGETSLTLDQIAQLASGVFGDYSSEAVTPDDVWNFILKYPNGVNSFYKQINPEYKELKDKFYDLTGVDISSTIFERAKQIMAEKDQASPIPTIEDFLGMSPDDMIKLEKEYEDFINENQANDERTKDEGETGEVHGPGTTGIRDGLPEEGRKTIRKPVQEEKPGEPTKGKPTRAEQIEIAKKGDKVKFTLGGKDYTLPSGDYKILPDGRITFDLFGQKTLKPGEYSIVPQAPPKIAGEKLERMLEAEPIQPKTINAPSQKIEDFGEKIEGAKKDTWKAINLSVSDIESQPLSKTFPRPDFVKLVADGTLTEDGAMIMMFLYDNIPTKPHKSYKVGRWAKQVQDAINNMNDFVENPANAQKFMDNLSDIERGRFSSLAKDFFWYRDVKKALGFPAEDVRTGQFKIKKFDRIPGESEPEGKVTYSILKDRYIIKDFDTLEAAASGMKNLLAANKGKSGEVKLSIYQDTRSKTFFIGRKAATGTVRLIDNIETLKEARSIFKEQMPQLQEMWQNLKVKPEERRKSNRPRVGVDYRKGKDVSPEEFANTFGFRGVQFGNWVNNVERQQALNEAYDGLMDLATALGITPKAISLGGELGLAFGARGSGKANAHYESGQVVINLTKTRGAGSLAHEWWHALDSYFSRKRGKKLNFLTQSPIQGYRTGENRQVVPDDRIRKEMADAFKGVVDAINDSKLPKRSAELDKARSEIYWSDIIEMSARSFENYIIEKLGANGESNDYLANFKEIGEWIQSGAFTEDSFPYPLKDESPTINESFDKFFQTIETKTDEDGNEILFRILGETGATNLDKAQEATTRMDNLSVAREMETAGKDTKDIRMATGWEKGADGKWKYELPDGELKLSVDDILNLPKTNNQWFTNEMPISDIIDMDNVINAYPEVKDYKVIFFDHGTHQELSTGSFADAERGVIAISLDPSIRNTGKVIPEQNKLNNAGYGGASSIANDKNSLKSAIVHEVQHLLQRSEGTNSGGNVEQVFKATIADKLAEIEAQDWTKDYSEAKKRQLAEAYVFADRGINTGSNYSDKIVLYARLSGEVEARNVQSRMNLTPEERRNTLLSETEDVSREDQIFIYDALGKSESRTVSPTGFYSTVENALDKIKQDKGTPEQFKAMLLKNGAKQAEMDWMGFDDSFEGKRSVTKQDIQDWIDSNRIEVQEVVKGIKTDPNIKTWTDWAKKEYPNATDIEVKDVSLSESQRRYDIYVDGKREIKGGSGVWFPNMTTDTKYSQYQLPGGENYKELLLTMPGKSKPKPKLNVTKESWEYGNINGEIKKIPGDIYQVYRKGKEFFKAKNLSEVKNGLKERISDYYGLSSEAKGEFKSAHFNEPNILAHIRFNERIIPSKKAEQFDIDYDNWVKNGKKGEQPDFKKYGNDERVLFIEEIQSDWAQKGKKEGFKQNEANPNLIIAEENRKWIVKNTDTGEVLSTFEKEMDAIEFKLSKLNQNGKVPDMPFKQTGQWVNLAIRKIMRYAAENGFDRIAWTNGEMQAERYDLSKQVEEIEYGRHPNGGLWTTVYGEGRRSIWSSSNTNEKELEDVIGKDMTKKIIDNSGEPISTADSKLFIEATKPQSIRELSNNVFGSEMTMLMPLDHVDGGVLATSKHDQVRKSIISFLPIDVMNILDRTNIPPDQLFKNDNVVTSRLPIESRETVAIGIVSAIRKTGALMRTELSDLGKTGREIFVLPTLKASDLNSREVAGIIGGSSLFHLDAGFLTPEKTTTARSITESLPIESRNALGMEFSSAELANFLNIHNQLIKGDERSLQQRYNIPENYQLKGDNLKVSSPGMKAFYDAIIPSAASKLGKPFGAKVENVNIQVKDGEPKGRYINPTITDAGYAMVRDTHNGNEEIYSPTNIPAERDQWLSDKRNNKEDRMDILTTVQSLPVTDAMRESVIEGQPLFRKGEDTETDILSSFIKKADEQKQRATRARELGEKLGVPVKIITNRSQLPARISRQMDAGRVYPGAFDKRTGQVYILVNEAHDIADIEKTIAHEVVAHKGLRELFGAEKFDALLDDVYDNMSNADKLIISQRYGTTDSKVIADEYIASLAETGNMPSWAGRVIANVRSLLREAGFNVDFSDADIIYLLWSSRNRLEKNASLTQYVDFKAREADVIENVRFSSKPLPLDENTKGMGNSKNYLFDNENAKYFVRFSDNIQSDLERGWSSWNFGGDEFTGTKEDLLDYINSTKENGGEIAISGFNIWVDEDSKISSDSKSVYLDDYEFSELSPDNWVAVDRVNAHNGLSAHALPENLNSTGDAINLIEKEKYKYDGTGDGESFGHKNARVIYSGETNGKTFHIIEVGENKLPSTLTINGKLPQSPKNNSDIRFRIAPKKNANPAGLDPRMVEGRFDKTREFLQDKMLSGKILMETIQKRGGKTPQSTDFYNAENRLHSRSLAMIEDFNDEELDKLNTTLAQVVFEHGVDLDDINQYLKAKSSLERNDNEGIDALNEDPLSDWSRGKVEGIITDFESKVPPGLVSKLWDDIKDATDYTIKQLYLGNVISKSAYDGMKARKYYVPLKSWQFKQGENPLDFYEYSSGDRTAYQGLRKAKGRGSEAADPLAFIQSAAHSAIVSANKNMMKHKMLMLARLNPDMKDLFNIKKIYVMQKGVDANGDPIYLNVIKDGDDAFSIINYDAAGNPTLVNEGNFQDLYDAGTIESKISKAHTSRRPQFFAAQHEIEVFENGNRYIVAFGDPNVANAINNANTYEPEITRKVQNIWLLGKLNRWVSANFTAKNPAFIPINWIRDFGYSVTSHGLQTDGNLKLFAKNYPKAIKGINNYLRGKADPTNNQIDKLYKAFRHYGGQTGYVHLREIKDLQENIQREVNLKGGKRIGIDKVRDNAIYKALGKSLDYMAIMSENSARFATFLASAEAGKSYEQAASDAKNISVNFNKKGRASGLFGSFYAFFNANIQGGHNFAHMAKHNKKQMAVTATSFLVAGYMLAELLRSFGPEDDDEKSEYEKLPDYVREQSLVIPAGDNGFITIPLPFGFREIYGIGVTLSDMAHGKSSPGEGMFSIMESAISAFSPIQPTSIEIKQGRPPLRSLVPTVAVPWYDIAVNQGFTGRELYKVPFVKNMERYTPNSELGAYNANSIMKGITSKINELGGGNEYTPAGLNIKSDGQIDFSGTRKFLFDWNPSKAEHLLEYYLGGRGRFFNDIFKTTQAAISSEKEVMSYNIPIFKRLYTKPYSGLHWNDYREIQTEVEDFNYLLKESEKRGDYETMQRLQGNYKMLTISDMLKSYDKPIKEIGDAIKVITDPEAKKELQKNRDLLIKNFVKQSQSIIQEPNN